MDEKLQKLIDAANANMKALKEQVQAGETKLEEQETKYKALIDTLEKKLEDSEKATNEELEDFKNELADLETKVKKPSFSPEKIDQKQFKAALVVGVADFVRKGNKDTPFTVHVSKKVTEIINMDVKAALNLTNTGEGLESVDEVLSREIVERAREAYPIINSVRIRNMPRNLREQVVISFPSVRDGVENVAGTTLAETDVQRFGQVVNKIAKVNAKPRITDEAMVGSDLDIYENLLSLLAEELGRWLAQQILFGDNSDRSMRGILSSARLDITNTTGESWKPTFGTGARPLDFYPALGSGVSGSLGATDSAIVDLLIDLETELPTQHLANAKWYMNRRTLRVLKKVRNADEEPIFAGGYRGEPMSIMGYPVVLEDYMPDIAANSTPIIFGDLGAAFSMSPGDIDKILIDPYTVDGCTVVKVDKEYFEIVGKNNAIVVLACTTNSGS